uniref:Uncharacterized protein n=1 Tax=Panagrolaimus sp. ES5 TaxID=591445 RepID=A0AC34GEV5_9BILA
MLQRQSERPRREEEPEPPLKKPKNCDPRPVNPVFEPPGSMFPEKGQTSSAAASKSHVSAANVQRSNGDKRLAEPSRHTAEKHLYTNNSIVDRTPLEPPRETRNEILSSSSAKEMTTKKSVGFSPPSSAAEKNSNQRSNNENRNRFKSPPPLVITVSEDEDDESEDEMPRHPPRGLSHYSKFISKRAVTPPRNDDNDEYLLESDSEENDQTNDATTEENVDKISNASAADNPRNDDDVEEEYSDEDVPRLRPRNLNRYPSSLSTTNAVSHNQPPEVISFPKQPVVRRSVFDFCDDEDVSAVS